MKKYIALLLAISFVFTIVGCNKEDDTAIDGVTIQDIEDETDWSGKTLSVWTITDDILPAAEAFGDKYGVTVQVNVISEEDYLETIETALESGDGVPDVYAAEATYAEDFVNSGYMADLTALGAVGFEDDYVDYVYQTGVDYEGVLRALSWQMTPGAIFYRRSIATEVLGTDDPAQVSAMMSSYEGLFDVADKLNVAGYKLFPDESAFHHFANPTQVPWVDADNNLLLPDEKIEYFVFAKMLRDQGYTALADEGSSTWYAGMQGSIPIDDSGIETTVFAYTLPIWGLDSILKTSMPEGAEANPTAGDWAVASGPNSYSSGGTWFGVYDGSEKKDIAFAFLLWMTHDEEYLKPWLMETGAVTSVKSILESPDYIEGRTEDFLGGQNYIAFFVEVAKGISGDKFTQYDQNLDKFFEDAVGEYVNGTLGLDEAIQSFKETVRSAYPEIKVD